MFRPLTPRQAVFDGVLAGLFLLAVLPFELLVTQQTGWAVGPAVAEVGATIVVAVFAAAVGVRRWSPALSLGLAWAGAIVQMSLARSPGLVDVAIFVVLYTTAAYGSRRVFWAGFASAVVGAVVITVYIYAAPGGGASLDLSMLPTAIAVLLAAMFALLLAWTAGALVRTARRARENRRAQVRAEADAVAEQERVRIARDMHDVVAHSLAVVVAQADGARYAAAADPGVATEALGTISTTARAALADVRLLLQQLRHSEGSGPQPTLADLDRLYAQVRAAGLDLRVDVDPAPPGVPPAAVQLAVFRILQEALTNALRHGGGGPVRVSLSWLPERVDLEVRNDLGGPAGGGPAGGGAAGGGGAGGGGAGAGEASSRGHGLIGMRERAQLAGGRLQAGATESEFVVTATVPLSSGPISTGSISGAPSASTPSGGAP